MSQEGKRNLNHISHQLRLRNMKDFKDIHGLLLWKYLVNEPLVGDKFFMEFWFWKDHILNASFGKQRRACVCVFVCERERKNRRERNGERERNQREACQCHTVYFRWETPGTFFMNHELSRNKGLTEAAEFVVSFSIHELAANILTQIAVSFLLSSPVAAQSVAKSCFC